MVYAISAYLREFVELLHMSSAIVLRGTQLRGEQGVDEGRLSETRFTYSQPIRN